MINSNQETTKVDIQLLTKAEVARESRVNVLEVDKWIEVGCLKPSAYVGASKRAVYRRGAVVEAQDAYARKCERDNNIQNNYCARHDDEPGDMAEALKDL